MQSTFTTVDDKDSESTKIARRDLSKVADWLSTIEEVENKDARDLITNIMRSSDTDLDVALNMTGYKSSTKSDKAKSALLDRTNGIDSWSNSTMPTLSSLGSVINMVESYYSFEDNVWSKYPNEKLISDQIKKLEKGTDYEKKKADAMLTQYPVIARNRTLIAEYRKKMRQNKTLDYLIRNYGG
jgi:hypothetical protein